MLRFSSGHNLIARPAVLIGKVVTEPIGTGARVWV